MLSPAQSSVPGPWRGTAPCPQSSHSRWRLLKGAREPRQRSENAATERPHLESWKPLSGTPFLLAICNAEQVCWGEALSCALPVPYDSSCPPPPPEGVAEAEERGTKNSQASSVRGREPRQHLPWVGRGPSPCHGLDRGSKTVWLPDVRPRPHPRPWGWQGRVPAPALGPLCWNPLPAPPFPPAPFSLPLWLHGFSALCAGAVERSCQSDLPTGTRTRAPALS